MNQTEETPVLLAIEPGQLSDEALRGVIEEFVSRTGTVYGSVEASLDAKVDAVARQLHNGEAVLVFNSEDNSCQVVTAEDWRQSRAEKE